MTDRARLRSSRLASFVTALVLLGGAGAGYAATQSSSGDHSVVLVNRHDGRFLSRAGFSTQRELGDTVDNGNAAAAVSADCSGCRTVAVAVQVVLVEGNPSVVTPTNLAIALNQNCSSCQSMAAAYQYVVSTHGIVRFTAEGEQEMAALRHQISTAAASDLAFSVVHAQLSGLVQQLWRVVDEEMRRVGRPFEAAARRDVDIESSPDGATESPSPSPETTASPAGLSPSPDPAESPSPCPTSSPNTDLVDPSPSETITPSPSTAATNCPTMSPTESSSPYPDESTSSSPSPEPIASPSPEPTASSSSTETTSSPSPTNSPSP